MALESPHQLRPRGDSPASPTRPPGRGGQELLNDHRAPDQAGGRCYLSVCRLSSSKQAASRLVEGELQRTFGENLRAYREARELSQETFADVLGIHRTYMGGIERGERNLTLQSVERIAGKLDLAPLVLLTPDASEAPVGS